MILYSEKTGKYYEDGPGGVVEIPPEGQAQAAAAYDTGAFQAAGIAAGKTINNALNKVGMGFENQDISALQQNNPVATTVGGIAPYMATAPLGGGLAAQMAIGAGTGAAFANRGDVGMEAALGAAGGAVGTMAGRVAGRLRGFLPKNWLGAADDVPQARALIDQGFDLSPAQRSASRSRKTLETGIDRTVAGADRLQTRVDANQEVLNRIAGRAMGDDSGATRLGREALNRIDQNLGKEFGAIENTMDYVPLAGDDLNYVRELVSGNRGLRTRLDRIGSGLFDEVPREGLTGAALDAPARLIDDVDLAPDVFMKIRSAFAAESMAAKGADAENMIDALDVLEGAFRESNDAGLWSQFRQASVKDRVMKAVEGGKALKAGDISLGSIEGNLRRSFKNTYLKGQTFDDPGITDEVIDLLDAVENLSSKELGIPWGNSGTGQTLENAIGKRAIMQNFIGDKYYGSGGAIPNYQTLLDAAPPIYGATGGYVGRTAPGLLAD